MAKNTHINYAGPGARVGIQAGNVVITGGITLGKDGIVIDAIITDDDNEDER